MDMTGTQIKALLEQQFSGLNGPEAAKSRCFRSRASPTPGTRPPRRARRWSRTRSRSPDSRWWTERRTGIVTNNFLSDGGDGFPAFTTATNKFFGGLDIDAFANYLTAHDPYTPVATDRISIGS